MGFLVLPEVKIAIQETVRITMSLSVEHIIIPVIRERMKSHQILGIACTVAAVMPQP